MSDMSEDRQRFWAFSFLRDRLPAILISLIFMALVDCILYSAVPNCNLLMLACCLEFLGALAVLGWSYMREVHYWRQV